MDFVRIRMMSNSEIEIPLSTDRYERRLIVFIDLIGFKNFVLSNHGDGKEESVKELTSYFQKKVSEGLAILRGNVSRVIPAFNFFSDSLIISYPLEKPLGTPDEAKVFFGNVCGEKASIDKFQLLFGVHCDIADIQLHALQHGLLTRGCVTLGDIYHNQDTWFGPGIIDAYEHESKIANHPRVILSKSGYEYFENEMIAVKESSIVIQDSDGYFYINYMGGVITKLDDDFCKAHHKLREIIVGNMKVLSDPSKYKELQKWQWLASYFNKYRNEKLLVAHGEKLSEEI